MEDLALEAVLSMEDLALEALLFNGGSGRQSGFSMEDLASKPVL